MKQIKKSVAAPLPLQKYCSENPLGDWDSFRRNNKRYQSVAKLIQMDQRGLCAYCEIDFLEKTTEKNLPDFRVEHFHPKSPHFPPPNWGLDWTNLFGTCHGGSQKDVVDPTRFTAPDLCCDVPKKDFDWTNDILSPLIDIPAFPLIFKFSESTGKIEVDPVACPADKFDKASDSLIKLNLNAPRLMEMRLQVIMGLQDQIIKLTEEGSTPADAAKKISIAMYKSNVADSWPAFFSCIRWYLGTAADDRLMNIGYGQ